MFIFANKACRACGILKIYSFTVRATEIWVRRRKLRCCTVQISNARSHDLSQKLLFFPNDLPQVAIKFSYHSHVRVTFAVTKYLTEWAWNILWIKSLRKIRYILLRSWFWMTVGKQVLSSLVDSIFGHWHWQFLYNYYWRTLKYILWKYLMYTHISIIERRGSFKLIILFYA